MEYASERLKPIVLLALNIGSRLGEIIGLTWGQVDWARGAVTVTRTKSGKRRSIPINGAVRAVLEPLRGGGGPPAGGVFGKTNTVMTLTRRDLKMQLTPSHLARLALLARGSGGVVPEKSNGVAWPKTTSVWERP